MAEPIVFVDSSEILEGKVEDVRSAVKELVAFVEANEPRPIAYNMYISEDGTRMTVVQIHPDSASMEFHVTVAASAFAGFIGLIRLTTMDIYGEPSDHILEQLRKKADMLGNATIVKHDLQAGLARFARQA